MEATKPAVRSPEDKKLAEGLVERSRDEGVDLFGPGGLLTGLTKNVLEAGLESEMSEHLGYDLHDPAGRNSGNSRNGTRAKTVPPMWDRFTSRCRVTGTAPSSRRSSRNGNGACRVSMRW